MNPSNLTAKQMADYRAWRAMGKPMLVAIEKAVIQGPPTVYDYMELDSDMVNRRYQSYCNKRDYIARGGVIDER